VEPTPAVEAKPPEDAKPAEEAKVPEVAPAQQAAIAPKAVEPAPVESKPAEPAPVSAPAPAPAVEPPSFDTVRIEPAGDAVIAGRAAPGAEVHVMLDGVQIGSVVASEDGSFAYVSDKPLPAGTGTLTLEVVKDGKTLVSETSVAVAVKDQAKGEALVAVLKPGKAPEIVQAPTTSGTQAPAGTVALDSVDYDKDGNIVFSGRGDKRSTVRLYVDNALAGEVVVGEDGKWSYAGGNTVTAGQHMLRADALKADGSVASRVELPFLREEAAKLTAASEGSATADQQSAAVDAATPEVVSRMVIQPGNNLWKLSRKIYGKGMRYTVIWEANKDQIRNPDLIYPGQIFVMPKAE
jgi:nucleoid-associated protein YgaU